MANQQRIIEFLTTAINVSTGLVHPNDKNRANELFLFLYDNGVILNAIECGNIAVQLGWASRHAQELSTLISKVQNGTRVRVKGSPWWNDKALRELLDD